jgi:hypothetical protein
MRIALAVAWLAAFSFGLLQQAATAQDRRVTNPPPDPGLFAALTAGSWGLADAKDCEAESHRFAFSANDTRAMITYKKSFTGIDGRTKNTSDYLVLYAEANKITMYLENESRRTDAGDRVVWVLILESPSRYSWRRTDWKPGVATAKRVRC